MKPDRDGDAVVAQIHAVGIDELGGIGDLASQRDRVGLPRHPVALPGLRDRTGDREVPAAVRHLRHLGMDPARRAKGVRSEEHTSELQSLMRTSYAVFCLKKKN